MLVNSSSQKIRALERYRERGEPRNRGLRGRKNRRSQRSHPPREVVNAKAPVVNTISDCAAWSRRIEQSLAWGQLPLIQGERSSPGLPVSSTAPNASFASWGRVWGVLFRSIPGGGCLHLAPGEGGPFGLSSPLLAVTPFTMA